MSTNWLRDYPDNEEPEHPRRDWIAIAGWLCLALFIAFVLAAALWRNP